MVSGPIWTGLRPGQICLTNRRFWKRTAADSLLRSLTPRSRSAPEQVAKSRCKRRARSAGRPADPTGDDPSLVHEVLSRGLAQGRPRSPRFSGQGLLAAARPRKGSRPKSKTREGARSEGRHLGEGPVVPRAEEFGRLGWASLLPLLDSPGPLLLFPGILRHAFRRGSRFARRLFPAQFFGLGGRQVQDDLVVGGDLPHATHRQ